MSYLCLSLQYLPCSVFGILHNILWTDGLKVGLARTIYIRCIYGNFVEVVDGAKLLKKFLFLCNRVKITYLDEL